MLWAIAGDGTALGAMQVSVIETVPLTVRRTARHIEQADPDLLKTFLMCGGRSVVA
jgi:hypothetical protein